ncbi:hypothetical protein AMATHDRAFT_64005 [Amanita thiersii Skay4041]|uniref:Uncharacterized protein n=1 Tax=Amanita thiersii Skay4041 TaxID=703135 RepID=A0A2A9NDG2_9AGAR|nr:hypothetical protein AMATHDRAFT_71667 [Amanita thiersii Skay4041]PFH49065.1 hypothetical protein AMATHDRAFT_64005 [Amanita thiersii Skay4041]
MTRFFSPGRKEVEAGSGNLFPLHSQVTDPKFSYSVNFVHDKQHLRLQLAHIPVMLDVKVAYP